MTSILDDVNNLLKSNKGDIGRLKHIKETLEQNKTLYSSDREYLQNLTEQYLQEKIQGKLDKNSFNDELTSDNPTHLNQSESFCGKCGKKFSNENNFCPQCGSPKNNQYVLASEQSHDIHPIHKTSRQDNTGIKSYQILAVIGGVLGLLVTLAFSLLYSFVDSLGSTFGRGFDESSKQYFSAAVPLVIIIYISCFIIPFVIKRTKIVGIYLIISSFIVIIASSYVGILGFALLLPAGIIALRKN
jgi:hypothetical protein